MDKVVQFRFSIHLTSIQNSDIISLKEICRIRIFPLPCIYHIICKCIILIEQSFLLLSYVNWKISSRQFVNLLLFSIAKFSYSPLYLPNKANLADAATVNSNNILIITNWRFIFYGKLPVKVKVKYQGKMRNEKGKKREWCPLDFLVYLFGRYKGLYGTSTIYL